jgi:hypothetical protein
MLSQSSFKIVLFSCSLFLISNFPYIFFLRFELCERYLLVSWNVQPNDIKIGTLTAVRALQSMATGPAKLARSVINVMK